MAQVARYVAERSIQSAGPLNTPVDDSLGRAVQNFGGQIGNAAAAMQEQQERRDNFKANAEFDKFKIRAAADLEAAARDMPEGGDGFTKSYLDTTFAKRKEEFMASLPESSRARFGTLLEVEQERFGTAAAKTEQAEVKRFQVTTVAATQQQLANSINIEPEKYNELYQTGVDQIDQMTGVTPAEKTELKQGWEKMAQTAHLDRILQDKPEDVLRFLGADSEKLSPTTKFKRLSAAVESQETGGEKDPDLAVSSAGALGRMQVMPGTAAEIAKEMGDTGFPQSGNDDQIRSYLSNPAINKAYGEHYLQKQLKAFGGDEAAALVAYNAGPGVAQKWLESGKNDAMLPAETLKYKNNILGKLKPDVAQLPPSDVKLVWARSGGVPLDEDLNKVSPVLRERVQTAFASMGIKNVRINSGFRDAEKNKRVGGAKESQHTHGNALDIDVSGMPLSERKELIRAMSASGITGIGIYANAIHADVGPKRAWGADHHGQSVPAWAKGVIQEHMDGNVVPPTNRGVNKQYASLDYATRSKYIAAADKAVSATPNTPQLMVERQQTRADMANDLASYRATGVGADGFDEGRVATYLGEDDYNKYVTQRDLNTKIFNSLDGLSTLPPDQLLSKAEEFEPIAGSPTFAQDQQVQRAVAAEVSRITSLRAKDPAKAAEELPEVKAAKEEALKPTETGLPDPQAMQAYVKTVMDAQASFNLPPNGLNDKGQFIVNRAPVDKTMAIAVGKRFSDIPPITSTNREKVTAQIAQNYATIKYLFGDYADDVILYSMSEYHGIDPALASSISGMMLALQRGRDPFAQREAPKVEKGLLERIGSWFGDGVDEEEMSAEEQRRIARDKGDAEQ